MVEHLPLHSKVKGMSPGTGKEKLVKKSEMEGATRVGSTVVEHLPCHPKVKGSSPATGREKLVKKSEMEGPAGVAQW